ncbi:MAG: helix-turn-helix domain-containing protein [Gemmataceae bacterium]|nr:helix-turn-helix domain-containing protein [Gemmataceae bacterium]
MAKQPKTPSKSGDELLSKKQVARMLGVCVRTVQRYLALAQFPTPVRLPHGHLRWRRSEVEAFLDSLPREKSHGR